MEKKNTILLTVIAIATLLVAVVGATFAYFTATVTNEGTDKTQTVVKTATLGITYKQGTKVDLGADVLPGKTVTNTFDLENTGDYDTDVDISWDTLTNTFTSDNLVYTLTSTQGDGITTEIKVPTTAGKITTVTVPKRTSVTYTLTVTLKDTGAEQNEDQGKTFDGTIKAEIAAGQDFTTAKE